MNNNPLTRHWEDHNKAIESLRATGACTIAIVRQGLATRLQVIAPKHEDFANRAYALLGRWNSKSRLWSFSVKTLTPLRELCVELYGVDNVNVISQKERDNHGKHG